MVKDKLKDEVYINSDFYEDNLSGKLIFRVNAKCNNKIWYTQIKFEVPPLISETPEILVMVLEQLGRTIRNG